MKIINGIKRIWCFLIGNLLAIFFYDREYFKGKDFKSRYGIIFAQAWTWVYHDGIQRLFYGSNKGVPWPVARTSTVIGWQNIFFHPNDLRNFQGVGNYFQAIGAELHLGEGIWIAPGVGFICSNHSVDDPDKRIKGESIIIGKKCWIGMNAVVLPGVILGDNTTVGAGSVVTHSFPKGNCVIAGNPAKIIKEIRNE